MRFDIEMRGLDEVDTLNLEESPVKAICLEAPPAKTTSSEARPVSLDEIWKYKDGITHVLLKFPENISDISFLRDFPKLETVCFFEADFNDEMLETISECKSLRSLHVNNCYNVDEYLPKIEKSIKNIQISKVKYLESDTLGHHPIEELEIDKYYSMIQNHFHGVEVGGYNPHPVIRPYVHVPIMQRLVPSPQCEKYTFSSNFCSPGRTVLDLSSDCTQLSTLEVTTSKWDVNYIQVISPDELLSLCHVKLLCPFEPGSFGTSLDRAKTFILRGKDIKNYCTPVSESNPYDEKVTHRHLNLENFKYLEKLCIVNPSLHRTLSFTFHSKIESIKVALIWQHKGELPIKCVQEFKPCREPTVFVNPIIFK